MRRAARNGFKTRGESSGIIGTGPPGRRCAPLPAVASPGGTGRPPPRCGTDKRRPPPAIPPREAERARPAGHFQWLPAGRNMVPTTRAGSRGKGTREESVLRSIRFARRRMARKRADGRYLFDPLFAAFIFFSFLRAVLLIGLRFAARAAAFGSSTRSVPPIASAVIVFESGSFISVLRRMS